MATMTAIRSEIRRGAYYDSVVLMQLQRALAKLDGVEDAGAVMGAAANKELLAQSNLLSPEAAQAGADDLILVVRAQSDEPALAALAQVDLLLQRRRAPDNDIAYRPKTLAAAAQLAPDARWVMVSTPGRYAAGVAREALELARHVLLYSDNVSLEDEVSLKREAAAQGLLLMGPDCGTAIVNGVGLGFANAVRRGKIGLVGASGTGLQLVSSRIHQLGAGITHALGTGGRDLSEAVGALTAQQSLHLLLRDPESAVVVLISKPPAPAVAAQLLATACASDKPVVVNFIGYQAPASQAGNLHYAPTLDEAAELAVRLAAQANGSAGGEAPTAFAPTQRYLRGLYSGGTLAYEAQLILRDYLPSVYSNAPLEKSLRLEKATISRGHTIVDLGEDEFTVGRLHPMMDHELRIRRLEQEANDPETAVILLDVVLGYGAHEDPAAELAPAIGRALAAAEAAGRHLEVVVAVIGTEDDPQRMDRQLSLLHEAGAHVTTRHADAVREAGDVVRKLGAPSANPPVALEAIHAPLGVINVGLDSFATSLAAQGAAVTHVEWRPPAGGNEKLMGILGRMKQRT
ncbi:MAG: acyl-CoA synthetase FdrA [Caldilineaceae bacterium]|nr:acyl-CoA synthetase FdrA [Caldilineaceae bacterium]